ncbi:MAG: hypothetical protein K1X79_01630 [Oligoflexia bacterium]|nr:hypothetical protein [Oligoflexia bacterium]
MQNLKRYYRAFRANLVGVRWRRFLVFIPGALLCLLGAAVLLAPRLVAFLVALFLVCLGALASFGAYRVLQMKARLEQVMRQFDGRISIQAMNIQPEQAEPQVESKKIIFH